MTSAACGRWRKPLAARSALFCAQKLNDLNYVIFACGVWPDTVDSPGAARQPHLGLAARARRLVASGAEAVAQPHLAVVPSKHDAPPRACREEHIIHDDSSLTRFATVCAVPRLGRRSTTSTRQAHRYLRRSSWHSLSRTWCSYRTASARKDGWFGLGGHARAVSRRHLALSPWQRRTGGREGRPADGVPDTSRTE